MYSWIYLGHPIISIAIFNPIYTIYYQNLGIKNETKIGTSKN